ncbi:MAG: hypothetical protein JWR72_3471 [Flavisolibacter sp.]|nr:hypothetical protein [Flavisolibacter sp.]
MNTNEENKRTSSIPENNSSKPMDSKRDVEQSNDEKIGQDFPGYPHYPAKEDIMDQRTGSHRVDAEIENMGTGPNASGVSQRFMEGQDTKRAEGPITPGTGNGRNKEEDDLGIKMGTDADVNSDDLAALDSMDAEIGTPQNVSNEDINTDMDIPGSELDDDNEERGEEDEENNYYSLGGDRHEGQEEDPQSGPDRTSI